MWIALPACRAVHWTALRNVSVLLSVRGTSRHNDGSEERRGSVNALATRRLGGTDRVSHSWRFSAASARTLPRDADKLSKDNPPKREAVDRGHRSLKESGKFRLRLIRGKQRSARSIQGKQFSGSWPEAAPLPCRCVQQLPELTEVGLFQASQITARLDEVARSRITTWAEEARARVQKSSF